MFLCRLVFGFPLPTAVSMVKDGKGLNWIDCISEPRAPHHHDVRVRKSSAGTPMLRA